VPLGIFRGASFFFRGLLSPLTFLGVPLFCQRSFEPMSEGSNTTPLFVDLVIGANALVEYKANLVSYFDPEFS
jgi:hypothetical protein